MKKYELCIHQIIVIFKILSKLLADINDEQVHYCLRVINTVMVKKGGTI